MSLLPNHLQNRQPHLNLKHQQGVVIVIALFIVAIVATMSYVMMSRLARDTTRTALILRNAKAEYYAQGSITWAIDQLRSDLEKQENNKITDAIPIKTVINTNNNMISSTIYDMQGRFNINTLTNATAQENFKRLLKTVSPKLNDEDLRVIVRNISDWISPAQTEASKYYLELPTPYRAGHTPMLDVSELRLVKNISPQLYTALKPYITALPANTLLNVQSAEAPVLLSISPKMTPAAVLAIIAARTKKPFVNLEEFQNLDVVKNLQIDMSNATFTVVSSYFLLETDVTIEGEHIVLYTLLYRSGSKSKANVSIVWQSRLS